jgi:hypothetical protein
MGSTSDLMADYGAEAISPAIMPAIDEDEIFATSKIRQ